MYALVCSYHSTWALMHLRNLWQIAGTILRWGLENCFYISFYFIDVVMPWFLSCDKCIHCKLLWTKVCLFVCSFILFSASPGCCLLAGCCCFLSPWGVAGLTGAKSSSTHGRRPGYTLNESPAHCRTLTDGSGCPTRCQLHIRSNSGV